MNRKTKIAVIGIIALVLVTIGITYAYWLVTKSQQGENVITTGCLDITLSGENDITLENQFPLSDEEGMKLTPYTFTVTNNCNTSVDYHINLESIGTKSTAIDSAAIKAVLNENIPKVLYDYVGADTTVANAYEAYTLGYGTLTAKDTEGSSRSYNLRLWIDEDAPISEMNKTFRSKISVSVGQGIISQGTELASLILENAETNNYLYTTTPDFNTVTADGEYGLYSATDDYGTSYYFRGDVENNYVKLGTWNEEIYEYLPDGGTNYGTYETYEECMAPIDSGAPWTACEKSSTPLIAKGSDMYWRIVRVNGDGTIRLVYDGTSVVANSESHNATIGKTAYNTNNDNAKYVGYTYDVDGTQTDSTIKGVVETWYANNLEADYGKYIADSIFCNDRQITSTSGSAQYYGTYDRLYTNKSPKLSCTQDADKYTVSSTKGNGLLTKPVGLMTADEILMAGGKDTVSNSNFYLFTGMTHDVSMSPYSFSGGYAYVWLFFDYGSLYYGSVDNERGARPVINLKAGSLFSGNGTATNPYVLAS